MSLVTHFLLSHLDFSPIIMDEISNEHGEQFHQEIKKMEMQYQGRTSCQIVVCFCSEKVAHSISANQNGQSIFNDILCEFLETFYFTGITFFYMT